MSVLVTYGCYECLRPHDGPVGLGECPFCGGFTGPMPADEQPTPEARAAVLAWEANCAAIEEGVRLFKREWVLEVRWRDV